ncbi:allophanate hydrolase [Acetobacter peroxydans]|jgi:allophanate hydrolase|uniref:allophanate hydrolase n=1 Tax=Acetobacter peroxydans TaxID=104098 RepID=UPI00235691F9|nr:allophanate hydrolase [Acetobacter peroxydans]MCH4144009.1 allophanate hydrolase [Acetobacter peroxydans]MCI1395397.1 allophanate hydrolase [Acetobacter peroxydans]MCI1412193.1 allophanate hydrolase [Acetobacter peroxydans]MCI1439852.1 allophanate hydrolase [Acetobacter peroxydans]MCI1567682.1 allophanate hydrolase [Acetobacter peroxydans]
MTLPAMLQIDEILAAYRSGALRPTALVAQVLERADAYALKDPAVWITRAGREDLMARAAFLETQPVDSLPLYGIPFAVKDNIDVAGYPTTAACPDFAYVPQASAEVVARLEAAGGIMIGKTNLDQFATGLVGTRSPYGQPHCVFDARYVSGGSSSGSGVAVAAGLVSFSLGTDTAGSGRVPAAINNIVGLKPTRGALSTSGVVPACLSLDCVSIFATTVADALKVEAQAAAWDAVAPYSRPMAHHALPQQTFRFGILAEKDRFFDGDAQNAALYEQAIRRCEALGGTAVELDYTPLRETAELLYGGAFVVERLAAIEPFFTAHEAAMDPTVAGIIGSGRRYSGADVFRAIYRQHELRQAAAQMWQQLDVMLLPTMPRIVSREEVAAQPVTANSLHGVYTNFVNLLDMSACAVPSAFRDDGLPFGVTFVAPAFADHDLGLLAGRFHAASPTGAGLARVAVGPVEGALRPAAQGALRLAVVGAHLKGLPLHYQLEQENAVLVQTTRTAPDYRLFALLASVPPKPGLFRQPGFDGPGLEVEIYELSAAGFGRFVASVPQPMAIGRITLADGQEVDSFLCAEAFASKGQDITALGGWKAYLQTVQAGYGRIRHQ